MTACGHIRKNRGLSRSPSVHMCCIAALACPLAHSDVVGPAPLSECLVFPKRAWGQRGQLAPCRAIDEYKEHGEGLKRLIHTKRRDKISGDTGGTNTTRARQFAFEMAAHGSGQLDVAYPAVSLS